MSAEYERRIRLIDVMRRYILRGASVAVVGAQTSRSIVLWNQASLAKMVSLRNL
jgi:hypothetical protein